MDDESLSPLIDPTIGRVMHFVLDNGEHRPCIVVRVWPGEFDAGKSDGYNVQVFTDGTNDKAAAPDAGANVVWRTSVKFDEACAPHTIHWPER